MLGQLQLSGNATDVAVDQSLNLAVVADGTGGLAIINVADPANPVIQTTVLGTYSHVQLFDGIAYASAGSRLLAFDEETGALLQTLSLGANITGVARDGSFLYTMDSGNTLHTVDLSGLAAVAIGSVTLPGGGNQIVVGNGIAYVGTGGGGNGGYLTVDVSNPASPVLIHGVDDASIPGTTLALNGSGLGIFAGQIQVFAQGLQNYLEVVNTTDPTNTGAKATQYTLPAPANGVAIAAGIGYVADGTSGLLVYNYAGFTPSTAPPVVTITQNPIDIDPATAGIQMTEGSIITIGANVSDPVQVASVQLLIGGKVAANNVSFPFDLSAALPTIAQNGGATTTTVQLRATDAAGNVTTTAATTITLVPDTRPLTLLSENVGEGAILSQFDRTFTLAFSRPVNPATVSAADFEVKDHNGAVVTPQSIVTTGGNRIVQMNYGICRLDLISWLSWPRRSPM